MAATIHPSAIVDAGAQLGDGTKVWHWVHVSAGARIGRRCVLGQNVFIGNDDVHSSPLVITIRLGRKL